MTKADIVAIAHTVTLVLVLSGVISASDSAGMENTLGGGIAAGCALLAQAAVAWKYIHHQTEAK